MYVIHSKIEAQI
uniref:Uncharacterized protein n=1 Tax=Rhizophora mucronata TaxID=61149 RepID=A0A2P2PIP9_RHIMU